MTYTTSQYSTVSVTGDIRLGQLLKLAGLVEDGAEARIAVQSGDVTVNGVIETRRGHRLADNDVVVVNHPNGQVGAVVEKVVERVGSGGRSPGHTQAR